MPDKRALITGITGQDGRYLADFLLNKGYEVHGMRRRVSYPPAFRLDPRVILHTGDMSDAGSLERILNTVEPHEIYNMAAMSDVFISFEIPEYTADVNGVGLVRMLDAIRHIGITPRVYQSSTSEMFGASPPRQSEQTPFRPRSPYAVAKTYAHQMAVNYRESYGMFISCGILFNHESPIRGHHFVTRKITRGLTKILHGLQDCLYLGNLDGRRDWGHARDYVCGQWEMLQQPEPDDFVLATGRSHSVRDFVNMAALKLGITMEWIGHGVDEFGINSESGDILVRVDPKLFRPSEVENLCGDASKARATFGWRPATSFEELVGEMVENDCHLAEMEARCIATT